MVIPSLATASALPDERCSIGYHASTAEADSVAPPASVVA